MCLVPPPPSPFSNSAVPARCPFSLRLFQLEPGHKPSGLDALHPEPQGNASQPLSSLSLTGSIFPFFCSYPFRLVLAIVVRGSVFTSPQGLFDASPSLDRDVP